MEILLQPRYFAFQRKMWKVKNKMPVWVATVNTCSLDTHAEVIGVDLFVKITSYGLFFPLLSFSNSNACFILRHILVAVHK